MMIFDCWVTLWQKPEVPEEKRSRALKKDMAETELNITQQILEPVINDAAAKNGVVIKELRSEFTRFSGTPQVPAVYFQVEAPIATVTDLLNLIGEAEDRPRVRSRGMDADSSGEEVD